MPLEQPDPDVLRRAQRGDERAFAQILRAYETPIFNYVYRIVGDRALAEDLTQEVFVRVFQALPRFSLRCKFTTWLFQGTQDPGLRGAARGGAPPAVRDRDRGRAAPRDRRSAGRAARDDRRR